MAEARHAGTPDGETLSGFISCQKWQSDLAGHAKLFAKPAYSRLIKAEPFLKRSIPVLIVAFLIVVAAARFAEPLQSAGRGGRAGNGADRPRQHRHTVW